MIYDLEEQRVELHGDEHYVAPSAMVMGDVSLGQRASVWFNAVVRGDCERIAIGDESNIQDAAVLHADPGCPLVIGRRVTVGHMAMLHGCVIGDDSLIGIKAVILNGARIGRNCVVGANTLIAEGKDIPDGSVVVGSPGRVLRSVSERDLEVIRHGWTHYVENMRRFRSSLTPTTSSAQGHR